MIEREPTEESRAVPALSTGVLAPVAGAARWVNRFARTKPLGAIGGAITLLLILIALFAPLLAPYGPKETLGAAKVHQPPAALASSSSERSWCPPGATGSVMCTQLSAFSTTLTSMPSGTGMSYSARTARGKKILSASLFGVNNHFIFVFLKWEQIFH